jgi:hypothetical protein
MTTTTTTKMMMMMMMTQKAHQMFCTSTSHFPEAGKAGSIVGGPLG